MYTGLPGPGIFHRKRDREVIGVCPLDKNVAMPYPVTRLVHDVISAVQNRACRLLGGS
jgi:hypothetical protein